jgi:hypothetical protein
MARLKWRSPVSSDGEAFADWVNALRGQGLSGVYLIRDAQTREIVYVGESHRRRLFETLTRHFYSWNGRGAGPSYHPAFIEVAIIVAETPLDDPVADQYELIQQHQPRDNVLDGHTLWWRMANRRGKGAGHGNE